MDAIFDEISFGVGRKNAEPRRASRSSTPSATPTSRRSAACRDGGAAARHRRLGQPLRRPVRGRRRPRLGRRALRLARLRPPDRDAASWRSRRARRSATARPRARWTPRRCLFGVDSELGQSYIAAMHLAGDYAYAGRDAVVAEGARHPGRRVDLRGPQPPQLRLARDARRRRRVGGPEGLHAGVPRPGGLRRRDDGRRPRSSCAGVDIRGLARPRSTRTVHGAGRVMSRTQAAGKSRRRWACPRRTVRLGPRPGRAPARPGALSEVRQPQGGQAHGAADAAGSSTGPGCRPPSAAWAWSCAAAAPTAPGRPSLAAPSAQGDDRNRTGVNGFAGRCVTTPPRRQAAAKRSERVTASDRRDKIAVDGPPAPRRRSPRRRL